MQYDVLTLFPEIFEPILNHSILKRAIAKNAIIVNTFNIRDFAKDKRGTVDDRPYGGGPGMLLKCEPVFDCVEHVIKSSQEPAKLILLTPQGETFNQNIAKEFAAEKRLLILCGHYEGFDERIRIALPAEEVSIGDYVLSGGEVAAMVVIDAVVRLLPGVLGHEESAVRDSFSDGLLDHPHYTRPEIVDGQRVPAVLLSGDHARIARWRYKQSLGRSFVRRPDLVDKLELSKAQRELLDEYLKEQGRES